MGMNIEVSKSAADDMDVFEAARWFDSLWNSRARAGSLDEIEWECRTWGSARGRCQYEDVAMFRLVAHLFDLRTDRGERDELIVRVQMPHAPQIVSLLERLDDDTECWPWLEEESPDEQIAAAASVLGLSPEAVSADLTLLDLLAIR